EDSASTFELRPATAAHSAVQDLATGFHRQILAGSEYRMGYEGWRRTREGTAYGAIGDVGMLRLDEPYTGLSERRSSLPDPNLHADSPGQVPWVLKSPRWRYALTAPAFKETSNDEYRLFVSNPTGEYLDRNGAILDQPQVLLPSKFNVFTMGGGLTLGFDFG